MRAIRNLFGSPEWSLTQLEALYELAYLRIFAEWETCLESVFYRSLCGYASRHGIETPVSGKYYRTVLDAETAVLGGQPYRLWHSPTQIIKRCQQHFVSASVGGLGIQESVIASAIARLTDFANIRHRIVHNQTNARRKFDAATLNIAGRTYPASRPGKFLRDTAALAPTSQKWLEVLVNELVGLAAQMV